MQFNDNAPELDVKRNLILASDSSRSYLNKEQAETMRLVTNDLKKSAAMETIEIRIEEKNSDEFCNFYYVAGSVLDS